VNFVCKNTLNFYYVSFVAFSRGSSNSPTRVCNVNTSTKF
jgi:hypothetical protein